MHAHLQMHIDTPPHILCNEKKIHLQLDSFNELKETYKHLDQMQHPVGHRLAPYSSPGGDTVVPMKQLWLQMESAL